MQWYFIASTFLLQSAIVFNFFLSNGSYNQPFYILCLNTCVYLRKHRTNRNRMFGGHKHLHWWERAQSLFFSYFYIIRCSHLHTVAVLADRCNERRLSFISRVDSAPLCFCAFVSVACCRFVVKCFCCTLTFNSIWDVKRFWEFCTAGDRSLQTWTRKRL